jgi:hypothetical protein
MIPFSISLLVGSAALALCPAIPAQGTYHLEFGGDGQGNEAAILANDSKTPIEAYFLSWRCGNHEGQAIGGWSTGDTLAGVPASFSVMSPTGTISRTDIIAPGNRAMVGNPSCDASVDAVLFADGTWAGDELAARGLKAWRDGLVACIDEWIDFLTGDRGFIQPLDTLEARASALRQRDLDTSALYPFDPNAETAPPALLQFWSGRGQVDSSLASWFDSTASWHVKAPPEALYMLRSWKAKVDGNKAMHELESVFPKITRANEQTVSTAR